MILKSRKHSIISRSYVVIIKRSRSFAGHSGWRYQKNDKIRDGKMLKNHSITTRNYAVTYYQTLVKVGWPLRLEKPKITKYLKKIEKNCKFHKKIAKICDVKTLKIILLPIEAMQ